MSSQQKRISEPKMELSGASLGGRPDLAAYFLASIVETSDDAIYSTDLHGIITSWNKGAERLLGFTANEVIGKSVTTLLPPDRRDEEPAIIERIKRGERIDHYETVRQRKDGTLAEISLTVSAIRMSKGGIVGISKIARDISDRRKTQQLIVRELHHRTQNLFAVFRAIATRAVDENKTAAEIRHVLSDRLDALARAYKMIEQGEGASLAAIIEREMSGFSKQVRCSGCEIIINPSATQQFALTIHELATNALKYGALSTPAGQISIVGTKEWLDGGGRFKFAWNETGGPAVTKPTRRGFGSVILLDAAKRFGQSVVLNYALEGLSYQLEVSLDAIEASGNVMQVPEVVG